MKALVNRGAGNFVVEDRPDPKPAPDQLLVRPAYTAVCFSDKARYDGLGYGSTWRDGLVLGHEFSGIVEAVGQDLDGWKPGDRVSVDPRSYCGQCLNCRGGAMTLCDQGINFLGVGSGGDGGYAELCVVQEYGCYKLPEGVGTLAASMAEPMCCSTRAARLSGFAVDDNAVVFGAEDYGLFMLEWLRRGGAKNVVVVDPLKKRQQAARELGATAVIDPAVSDVEAAVREYMPRGADIAFVQLEDYIPETLHYLSQAYEVSRNQGSVVILRVYGRAPFAEVNPQTAHLKEVTQKFYGWFFGNEPIRGGRARGDWQVTLEAMATGMVCPPPGTQIFDFEDLKSKKDVDEMFQGLPHSCNKAIVKIAGD